MPCMKVYNVLNPHMKCIVYSISNIRGTILGISVNSIHKGDRLFFSSVYV